MKEVIMLTPPLLALKDQYSKLMLPYVKRLHDGGFLNTLNPDCVLCSPSIPVVVLFDMFILCRNISSIVP